MSSAWVSVASLLLSAGLYSVQGAEPQPSMPPALLEAIEGREPYHSLVEHGLPLISTSEEVAALPQQLRQSQASAMKRVLLEQMLRARKDGFRISSENFSLSALQAHQLGAPGAFVIYHRLEAEGQLTPRERYAINSALQRLYEDYLVNVQDMRLFIECVQLSSEELLGMLEWLPLDGLFNLVRMSELTSARLEHECRELIDLASEISEIYASIDSPETAAAAVELLLPLLGRYQATAGLRYFASPHQVQLLARHYGLVLRNLGEQLSALRTRVREANYYDNLNLRVVDYLLR